MRNRNIFIVIKKERNWRWYIRVLAHTIVESLCLGQGMGLHVIIMGVVNVEVVSLCCIGIQLYLLRLEAFHLLSL